MVRSSRLAMSPRLQESCSLMRARYGMPEDRSSTWYTSGGRSLTSSSCMSHLRLPPVGDGCGAPELLEVVFFGMGGGGGAALFALPSCRLMLMPSWGGCCCWALAAFAAPSAGVNRVMMSARRRSLDGVGGAPLYGGTVYNPWR